jgi:L-rhamnose mutarotase
MQRVCFILQVRPDRLKDYMQTHAEVWPQMLDALGSAGWRNYTMFSRSDGLVVGYLETESFEAALAAMAATEVNARWQSRMDEFFELPDGERPDTVMAPLHEYFHLD